MFVEVLAHNISLSNRGGYAALLFSQTSVPWKHEDQPALQFRWFLQDREVNLMKEPIPPGASVILTVEGSMTAIHAPVSVVRVSSITDHSGRNSFYSSP